MSKIKIFLILSGYQLTWMLCIFGELLYNTYIPGLFGGVFFLFISFFYSKNKIKLLFILILLSIPGYLFDSALVFFGVYNFQTSLHVGFLPVWMIVLWPSFIILFDEVFIFLSKQKVIAVVLSSILGPLTYYAGVPLGLIVIYELNIFIIFMVFFWAVLMVFYLNFILKLKFI